MRRLSTRVRRQIAASSQDIWAYRIDFLHLPEYNPSVKRIERIADNGSDGSGAHYRFELQRGDRSHLVDLTVTRSIPSQLVSIALGGALPAEEHFSISAGDAEGQFGAFPATGKPGCLVTMDLTLLVPDPFPPATDPQLLSDGDWQMTEELDALARILEAGSESLPLS